MQAKTMLIGAAAVVGALVLFGKLKFGVSAGSVGPAWKYARPSGVMSMRYTRSGGQPMARVSFHRDDTN